MRIYRYQKSRLDPSFLADGLISVNLWRVWHFHGRAVGRIEAKEEQRSSAGDHCSCSNKAAKSLALSQTYPCQGWLRHASNCPCQFHSNQRAVPSGAETVEVALEILGIFKLLIVFFEKIKVSTNFYSLKKLF